MRAVQSAGGFAMLLQKGDADYGAILVAAMEKGANLRIFERLPSLDGAPEWQLVGAQSAENQQEIEQYLARRRTREPDLWMIELDIAQVERFIGLSPIIG